MIMNQQMPERGYELTGQKVVPPKSIYDMANETNGALHNDWDKNKSAHPPGQMTDSQSPPNPR